MLCPRSTTFLIALWLFAIPASNVALSQDKPVVPDRYEERPRDLAPRHKPQEPSTKDTLNVVAANRQQYAANRQQFEEVKPLPPVAIPDDPPPHEGAFFDVPVTIEPPDIIIVEVLEALPGRPITGERLVRPDGTISLGFYGDIYVRGLTITQVKVKVLQHLRKFMSDEVLGLVTYNGGEEAEVEMRNEAGVIVPPLPGRNPFDLEKKPESVPEVVPPVEKKPEPDAAKPAENNRPARPPARPSRGGRPGMRRPRRPLPISAQVPPSRDRRTPVPVDQEPVQIPKPDQPAVVVEPVETQVKAVPPADSMRVFVDITAHNSKVYYVQGDVGVPGRLPVTGTETVLDALNYAGGFLPSGEPADVHLYRPARGGKPARDYLIDVQAIYKGVATANLQIFPNDRIIIGRNPIVKKTIEVDRAAALINSTMNSILQHSFSARSLATINTPLSGSAGQIKVNGQNMPLNLADPIPMTPAQRDALYKDWFEFFWSISSKEGGAMLDEKVFREALMKKLTPASEPK
jgi:protein involved in polysaccharide export with SLBB domain